MISSCFHFVEHISSVFISSDHYCAVSPWSAFQEWRAQRADYEPASRRRKWRNR